MWGSKQFLITSIFYLRNVPCFYRVIKTRVEVWENEKCCGNTSLRRVFPQLFRVLPNFHECWYNSIETRSTCFLFLLENNATREKGKQLVNFDYQNVKFSVLTLSLRQQRKLALCPHRVIQIRFLTNQRACFLRIVFYFPIQHNPLCLPLNVLEQIFVTNRVNCGEMKI